MFGCEHIAEKILRSCAMEWLYFKSINQMEQKRILITGGTSGLGEQLASRFLQLGFNVIITGREFRGNPSENLEFLYCDFTDLSSVVRCAKEIGDKFKSLDLVINNAGILSPGSYTETIDGYEISYQVNFLSHVLFTTLLREAGLLKTTKVINLSSPIYKRGTLDVDKISDSFQYEAFRTYASTKLFMALFSVKLAESGQAGFSFDPGTFSSGIYRAREKWFHVLYKIAAPFMIPVSTVARKLVDIILFNDFDNGEMVNKRGVGRQVSWHNDEQLEAFWRTVHTQLTDYVKA